MEQKYIDRFHKSYSPEALTGCWIWLLAVDQVGYGQFSVKDNGKFKTILAHRFSALIHGLDMSKPVVRHICNNPSCVNPAHLTTGTHQDNTNDMLQASREARGSRQGSVKLTEQQVLEIRSKYIPRTYSYKRLAKEYGVDWTTIQLIVKRITWKHL